MKKTSKILTGVLILVTMIEIFGHESISPLLVYVAKPVLMPLVAIIFYIETKEIKSPVKQLVFSALAFSCIGDVLLMLGSEQYFLIGILAFLMAHLRYIRVFSQSFKGLHLDELRAKINLPVAGGIMIYFLIFESLLIYQLINKGQSTFAIFIFMYGIVLCGMFLFASLRQNIEVKNYNQVLNGAGLFVISDSLIAIHKFVMPIPYDAVFIMSTYVFAQWLITQGIAQDLKQTAQ